MAELLRGTGLAVARRSTGQVVDPATAAYVADTIGELGLFYRLARVAFIGGSWVDRGGQNPFEAAQLGCAVLIGPNMWNFPEITTALLD